MYAPAFPHIAWLITVAGFGAIIIGAALMFDAGNAFWRGAPINRVEADGALGVRFILGGVAVLVGFGIWRLI